MPDRSAGPASRLITGALCAAAGVILSFWLSGMFRAGLETSLQISLLFGAIAAIALLGPLRSSRAASRFSSALPLTLLLGAFALFRLYDPKFQGMPSVGGGDAADHAFYTEQLLYTASPYNGLVGFHAVSLWLETLFGFDPFETFRFVTYLSGAALYFLTFIVFVAASDERQQERFPAQLYAAALFLAISELSFLPLFHYLQADGFYPQLFGALVLFLAWCGYSTATVAWGRAVLVFCVLLSRFTYVLNTGELLIVIGALALIESRGKGTRRGAYYAVAAGAGAAAFEIYKTLLQLAPLEGGLRGYDLPVAIAATGLLSLALLNFGLKQSDGIAKRSAQFAGLYGVATAAAQLTYLASGLPARYYLIKHGFYSILLLCCVSSITLVLVLCDRRVRITRSLTAVALIVGLAVQAFSLRAYYPSYHQRAAWSKVTPELYPLADRQAWPIVEDLLARRSSRFGGFITSPYWPLCQFMNASLGYFHYRRQPFYRDPALSMKPGRCVFWSSTKEDLAAFDRISRGKVTQLIAKLSEQYPVERVSYRRTWAAEPQELSYVCIPPKERR